MTEKWWHRAILPMNASIQEAIINLDKTGIKIVLIEDEQGAFIGTLSDGDIRRGLLRGLQLHESIEKIIEIDPLVVTPDIKLEAVKQIMREAKIHQIPVIGKQKKIVDIYLWDRLDLPQLRSNTMIIMAGGLGVRLRPHTNTCPKPMLPVGGKPMLEHIIERAKRDGINKFLLSVHYLGETIENYFEDGKKFGVSINYLREGEPSGTAGALRLISPTPSEPVIVTNGDVLSDLRYGDILDFHLNRKAVATMAVKPHQWQHPYGVIQLSGDQITGIDEKPIIETHINAGVYVLSREVFNFIGKSGRYDMTTLFSHLLADGLSVTAYPLYEQWLDVGIPDDLNRANRIHE